MLSESPERVRKIYISRKQSTSQILNELGISPDSIEAEVVEVDPQRLDAMCQHSAHQGIVLELEPPQPVLLNDLIMSLEHEQHSVILVLDSIEDPSNLGSILRAAECFGADAVILSSNRGCRLTSTARKVSVGASELVPVVTVSNLSNAIESLKEARYWCICCELSEESQDLFKFSFPDRSVIVLGSEGEGIQDLLSRRADFKVKIPMCGRIDSLNVGQACAVFLSQFRSQFPK